MSNTAPTTGTAIRTRKGAKTTITITLDNGFTRTIGGKRAERAEAVAVAYWDRWGQHEVSASASAATAYATANRWATQTTQRLKGGGSWPVTPAAWALALDVVDAEAAVAR